MPLKRWEVQILGMIAKNRQNYVGRDLFAKFSSDLSGEAKAYARKILNHSAKNKGIVAEALVRRADARNESRKLREKLVASEAKEVAAL